MGTVIGSLVVLLGATILFFVGGAAASIVVTVAGGIGYMGIAKTPAQKAAPIIAFVVMLGLYLGWALACWIAAEKLALVGAANRWVLLFAAASLAGAPYHWALRSKHNSTRERMPVDESFGSALEFAGGLQSKIVVLMMLAGIYFDFWPSLPG